MNVLLMTATITPPPDAPDLARTDPQVRLGDYLDALDFYIGRLGREIDRIFLFENSNSDVSRLEALAQERGVADRVRIISYPGLDYPANYGRCYGEMRLLNYGMNHSELAALPQHTIFWKVTGRAKVKNLRMMVRTRPRNAEFYADMREGRAKWFDMRVMSWTRAGFASVLTGFHELIREDENHGRPGEETACREIGERIDGTNAVLRFRREPLIDGFRGADNKNWSQGRQLYVYGLRQAQRMLLGRVLV